MPVNSDASPGGASPSASDKLDRRGFLSGATRQLSGSFVLGAAGGTAIGAVGMWLYENREFKYGTRSYAQIGEDLVVAQILDKVLGIKKPTYLDVGAYDPISINNTYLFYEQGCQGVLVEPNPALWDRLHKVRPRDTLLKGGIGLGGPEKEADYYVIGGGPATGVLNTFSKEEADTVVAKSNGAFFIQEVLKMPFLDINAVMAEHFQGAPNFVSIDTEGLDLAILKTIDFQRYRPDVFCVETMPYRSRLIETPILDLMASKNYMVRGGSFVNTVFVDKRHIV